MSAIYILIVTSWVHGGSVTTFQEFGSGVACETARRAVAEHARNTRATCVPKS